MPDFRPGGFPAAMSGLQKLFSTAGHKWQHCFKSKSGSRQSVCLAPDFAKRALQAPVSLFMLGLHSRTGYG